MTAKTLLTDQPDLRHLVDQLLDFTADLLALNSNQEILEGLFRLVPGQPIALGNLVQSCPKVTQKLVHLEGLAGGKLQITWLRHLEMRVHYSLVLFLWNPWSGII